MSGLAEELLFRAFLACFLEVLRGVAFSVDMGSMLGAFLGCFGGPSGYFGTTIFEVLFQRPQERPKAPKMRILHARGAAQQNARGRS